jgi:DNA-directed RNA polymerase subunit L
MNNEVISFDLNNDSKEIKTSFANALRRTIISDIYTYIINNETIIFFDNTSMLNNEFLKHRLTLIPIISDLDNINYEDITITCKKKNENENMENIYVSDFICIDNKNNIIDNNILFKYPNILFAKLKNNQFLSFECKLTKNNAYYGGSFFSPVSVCVYTFKLDDKKVNEMTNEMSDAQKKTFASQDIERIYKKNENGDPYCYQFQIESSGFYNSKNILLLGIDALKERLNNLKIEFKNQKSKKITLLENNENPDFFEFLIDHENETIGNLLSTYITYNPNIYFCGYVIEHPLKNNIILRIKLKEENTLDNNIKIIDNMITYLIDLLDKMTNDIKLVT